MDLCYSPQTTLTPPSAHTHTHTHTHPVYSPGLGFRCDGGLAALLSHQASATRNPLKIIPSITGRMPSVALDALEPSSLVFSPLSLTHSLTICHTPLRGHRVCLSWGWKGRVCVCVGGGHGEWRDPGNTRPAERSPHKAAVLDGTSRHQEEGVVKLGQRSLLRGRSETMSHHVWKKHHLWLCGW